MSGAAGFEGARALIDAQIQQLGELRNAGARDPGFKAWRQSTLTVIQRIWPAESGRAERFRRVPFSAPSSKMSATMTREFYEKGCAEATRLLREMAAEATQRAPGADATPRADDAHAPGSREDDFPVLDLPGSGTGHAPRLPRTTPAAPAAGPTTPAAIERVPEPPPVRAAQPPARPMPRPMVGRTPLQPTRPANPPAGAPPSHTPAPPAARHEPPAHTPAPPAGHDSATPPDAHADLDAALDAMHADPRPVQRRPKPLRRDRQERTEPPSRPNAPQRPEPPARQEGGARDADPRAPEREGARPPRGGRPRFFGRRALREMLGFGEPQEATGPLPELREPTASPDPRPEAPAAKHPEPVVEHRGPRLLPSEARGISAPREEEDDPFAPPEAEESAPMATSPLPPDEDEHSEDVYDENEPLELVEAVAPDDPEPPVEPDEPEPTGDSVMDDFLRNSPVLRARAHGTTRPARPAAIPLSPAAASLAALAGEVAHLGVPEGQRAGARAALLDLARQFDDRTVNWDSLRQAVTFVMDYPALARRVIPMIIPYLDLSA